MLRIGLFLGTNLAVLFVLNLNITVFGLNQAGMSVGPMIIMAGVVGMAGSFISLLISKTMAKRSSIGAAVVATTKPAMDLAGRWLSRHAHDYSARFGISGDSDRALVQSLA